jgi:hypothetical protein
MKKTALISNSVFSNSQGSMLSPNIHKAGIILLDPVTTQVSNIVVLQYSNSRAHCNYRPATGEPVDRSEALHQTTAEGVRDRKLLRAWLDKLNHVTAAWETKGSTEMAGCQTNAPSPRPSDQRPAKPVTCGRTQMNPDRIEEQEL